MLNQNYENAFEIELLVFLLLSKFVQFVIHGLGNCDGTVLWLNVSQLL